ncbi:hypothetical protein HDV01_002508 [Terramyces sp. JEL0728]|nr:hypothetical protein HDV01_002508 [Terramyces sp. JEL0728]
MGQAESSLIQPLQSYCGDYAVANTTSNSPYVMNSSEVNNQSPEETQSEMIDANPQERNLVNFKTTSSQNTGSISLSIDTSVHPAKQHHVKSPMTARSNYPAQPATATTSTATSSPLKAPSSPSASAILGNVIMRKKGSISFFIDLLSPEKHPKKIIETDLPPQSANGMKTTPMDQLDLQKSPRCVLNHDIPPPKTVGIPTETIAVQKQVPRQETGTSTATITKPIEIETKTLVNHELKRLKSFPKIKTHLVRPPAEELRSSLAERMESAATRRTRILNARKMKLYRDAQTIKYKMLIHDSRQRLEKMRLHAKVEYNAASAQLNRQMILRKIREQFGAKVEHAKRIMLIQKMHKFMELRRALSENFTDYLKQDFNLTERDLATLTPMGLNVTLEEDEYELDEEHQHDFPSSEKSEEFPNANQREFHSAYTSANASAKSSNFLFKDSPVKAESLTASIRRTKSLPDVVLKEGDDVTFLELLNLLPPITRFTLRELDMDEILGNAQLRHDIIFDADLQFKPGVESDEDASPKQDAYWQELEQEIAEGQFYRVPLLLAEVRAILIELLPNGLEIKDDLMNNIDTHLIAQQIEHGIMNPGPLITYIADIMKTNCAPIRDPKVDAMVAACQAGDVCHTLQLCFEILELMKLDYANHQLSRLRPHILEHSVTFEWKWFKNQFESGQITVDNTRTWLEEVWTIYKSNLATSPNPNYDLFPEALVNITLKAAKFSSESIVPETLQMDVGRLIAHFNSWQDITILSSILVVFKQAAGPKCTNSDLIEAKTSLWVLLNDSESTMSHITLQMAHLAGKIRGKAMSPEEITAINSMTEKTLAPESKLYELIQKRVGIHVQNGLNNEPINKDLLNKHALVCVEKEIEELIKKLQTIAVLNKAVYGKLYSAILEDIKNGEDSLAFKKLFYQ